MLKYKLHNVRKGQASTSLVGGKRITLKAGEEKVISFTDFKKFETPISSLVKSGIITCEKLTGKSAEVALSKDDAPTIAPAIETKPALTIETKPEGSEEAPEGSDDTESSESTEGSTDETKAHDSDDSSSDDDSDADANDDETTDSPEATAPQHNQGGRNNRNRNRNR